MTTVVLVTGKLFGAPQRRTSSKGKPFVTGKIREGFGDEARFWNVICFYDAAFDELLELGDGDGVAASGPFTAEIFTDRKGVRRISYSLVAERVISARRRKREKHEKREERPESEVVRENGAYEHPAIEDATLSGNWERVYD